MNFGKRDLPFSFTSRSIFFSPQVKKLVEKTLGENSAELTEVESKRDNILKEIGNVVADDVPVSQDEVST